MTLVWCESTKRYVPDADPEPTSRGTMMYWCDVCQRFISVPERHDVQPCKPPTPGEL